MSSESFKAKVGSRASSRLNRYHSSNSITLPFEQKLLIVSLVPVFYQNVERSPYHSESFVIDLIPGRVTGLSLPLYHRLERNRFCCDFHTQTCSVGIYSVEASY